MGAAERSWHRGYLLYALCVIGVLMFSIDGSIVAVALPTMMTDLNTTLPLIAWTLAGYTLAQVALQPAIAKFSDNFGRNRVFLVCIFIFTLSSLLCAVAPNVLVLIACRVLQAIGGSGLMPSATGIVVSTYPAHHRERLIGLFTSIIPMGAIIGPNLGGLILTQFSWRGIFFINLPIGLAIMFLLRHRFFADKPPERQKPIDYPGILLFATSIASLMIALTSLGSDAAIVRSFQFWGLLLLALAVGWLFVRQEKRVLDPMLDFAIAVRPPFLQVNLYNLLYGMGIFSVMSFVPYFAETRFGMSPAETGLLLTPRSVMIITMSTVASVWLLKYGYRWPMVGRHVDRHARAVADRTGLGWPQPWPVRPHSVLGDLAVDDARGRRHGHLGASGEQRGHRADAPPGGGDRRAAGHDSLARRRARPGHHRRDHGVRAGADARLALLVRRLRLVVAAVVAYRVDDSRFGARPASQTS